MNIITITFDSVGKFSVASATNIQQGNHLVDQFKFVFDSSWGTITQVQVHALLPDEVTVTPNTVLTISSVGGTYWTYDVPSWFTQYAGQLNLAISVSYALVGEETPKRFSRIIPLFVDKTVVSEGTFEIDPIVEDSLLTSIADLTARLIVVENNYLKKEGEEEQSVEGIVNFDEITIGNKYFSWNTDEGTFDVEMLNGAVLQLGQEFYFYGKATQAINEGQPVQFAGAEGGHIKLKVAVPSEINDNPEYLLGIATTTFSGNGVFGYVTMLGKVRGLNTNSYNEGDVLWFDSVNGGLTTTMPPAPNAKIRVCAVLRKHGTQGSVMVRPDFAKKLGDLQNVDVNGETNGSVLEYVDGVWQGSSRLSELETTVSFLEQVPEDLEQRITDLETSVGDLESTVGGLETSVGNIEADYVHNVATDKTNDLELLALGDYVQTAVAGNTTFNTVSGNETHNVGDEHTVNAGTSSTINAPVINLNGETHINGNIIQSGESYETHAEQVYTTQDIIYLRDGAVGALGTGEYVGLVAQRADGTNDAMLIFDGNGTARVGDEGSTQALATRQDSPVSQGIAYWNNSENRFDTNSELALIDNKLGVGTTSPTEKLEINGNVKATNFIGDGSQLTNIQQSPIYLDVSNNDRVAHLSSAVETGGLVANIKGNTLQATQLVSNGDFDDYSGWVTYSGGATHSVITEDNTLKVVRTSLEENVSIGFPFVKVSGKKLYTSALIKSTATITNAGFIFIDTQSQYTDYTMTTSYQHISALHTLNAQSSLYILLNSINMPNVGEYIYIKNVTLFDVSTLIANKQFSPLYNKTFDTMSDSEIKAQMDLWVANGTLPNDNIQSVSGSKQIVSVGKNLFDYKKVISTVNDNSLAYLTTVDGNNVIAFVGSIVYNMRELPFKFAYNTQYTLKIRFKNNGTRGGAMAFKYTDDTISYTTADTSSWSTITLTSTSGKTVDSIIVLPASGGITYFDIDVLQLELGSTATTYEPYISTDLVLEAPKLNRLPNGVYDEIQERNGKYYHVKRVQEYTLQASDLTILATDPINVDVVLFNKNADSIGYNNTTYNTIQWWFMKDYIFTVGFYDLVENANKRYEANNTLCGIIIAKSTYANLAAAQSALAGTKILYQLATPVETEIKTLDQINAYKSGTVYNLDNLTTGLEPISTYTVPANIKAQVVENTTNIGELSNDINDLYNNGLNGVAISGGKVGIGTTNPETYLEVSNGTVRAAIGHIYSNTQYFGTITNHNSCLISNNLERMRITTEGNIGIGTISPSEKLEVNGKIKTTDLQVTNLIYDANNSAGGSGKVLTINPSSLKPTWTSPASTTNIYDNIVVSTIDPTKASLKVLAYGTSQTAKVFEIYGSDGTPKFEVDHVGRAYNRGYYNVYYKNDTLSSSSPSPTITAYGSGNRVTFTVGDMSKYDEIGINFGFQKTSSGGYQIIRGVFKRALFVTYGSSGIFTSLPATQSMEDYSAFVSLHCLPTSDTSITVELATHSSSGSFNLNYGSISVFGINRNGGIVTL